MLKIPLDYKVIYGGFCPALINGDMCCCLTVFNRFEKKDDKTMKIFRCPHCGAEIFTELDKIETILEEMKERMGVIK